jgi:hypothetical protein
MLAVGIGALFAIGCSNLIEEVGMPQDPQDVLSSTTKETFVSSTKAAEIATAYLGTLSNNPATKSNARISSTETIVDSRNNNEPLMYVMNYVGGGFVIVGATTNYYPVLAYSEENTFVLMDDMGKMGGVVIWLEETKEAIRQSEALDEETKFQIRNSWQAYDPVKNDMPVPLLTKGLPWQNAAYQARRLELISPPGTNNAWEVYSLADSPLPWYLADYYKGIADSYGSPYDCTIVGYKVASFTDQQVGPLLKTTWNPWPPFNDLCNGHYVGCVAVAMAQIMKFHSYPATFTWSNMPDSYLDPLYVFWTNPSYPNPSTPTLMKDVSDAAGIDYYSNDPRSDATKALNAFKNTYGYYTSYKASHNGATVVNELLHNNRPVFMGGYDPSKNEGHAWVCDGLKRKGYETAFFIEYIFGNSGSCYFSSALDPSLDDPYVLQSSYSYFFHMNWGFAGLIDDWYLDNNYVAPTVGNFYLSRDNVYVSK